MRRSPVPRHLWPSSLSSFDQEYLESLPTNELRIRREILNLIIQEAQENKDPLLERSGLLGNLELLDDVLSTRKDYDPSVPLDLGSYNRARKG